MTLRVSITLTVVALVPMLASPAAAEFTVSLIDYDAEGASVDISVTNLPDCSGYSCFRLRSFYTIEPCPPGQPCVGGVSQIEIGLYGGIIALAYATHYTITGYSTLGAGNYQQAACTYDACTWVTETVSQTYDVPARDEVARWQVAPLEAAGSNIWVDVSIESQYVDEPPCYFDCARHHTQVTVSPCPLSARTYLYNQPEPVEIPVDCEQGTATIDVWPWPTPDPGLQLLLAPGVYLVDGHWSSTFGDSNDACFYVMCSFGAYPAPITFNTATLPVQETTWGRIKALYHR